MTAPFIIDVHGHIGRTRGFRARFHSPAEVVRLMDLTATEIMIFSAMPLLAEQFEMGYREAVETLEAYPTRFRAYTVFDPNWPDVSLRLLEQHQTRPGFVGIKVHPSFHGVAPEDPRYRDLWAFANEHALTVLTHSWAPDPANPTQNLATADRFADILARHPRLRVILGHLGGRDTGIRLSVDLMRAHANCYADISGDTHYLGLLEHVTAQVGPDRLLYGTDVNWIEPRYHVGRVLKARLSADDRMRIYRNNALRVFPKLGVE